MLLMDTKIYLSPLSGITDLAFRLISRRFGARFCYFEMLDANALIHDHPGNRRLMKTIKGDTPIAAQLVGADPSIIFDAAEKLLSLVNVSSLELNSACPAKKVLKKKAGAYLLNDPGRLEKILKKLSSGLRIPVTVKLRARFYKKAPNETAELARVCESAGVSKIFIHGRTAQQGYSGEVDYESIKAAKSAIKIPVFGSGNIFSAPLAKKMFDETGCDGVLAARGALGNPWIFKEIEDYLANGKLSKGPDIKAKKKILKQHLAYVEKYKEMAESNKVGFMGKIAMWYLKGIPDACRIREQICKTKSYRELTNLIFNISVGHT